MFRVRSKEIQRYTPAGRLYHQAVSIDGKVYMWGGAGNVNPRAVEVFDLCTETWVQHITKGTPHPGIYRVACTATEGCLYAYGGMGDMRHQAVLSKLDVSTFTWSRISPHDPSGGPMRKWECDLVCFHGCILILFGGYGIPNDPIQPGSEFIQDERYKHSEVGWTNELHAFDLRKGQYVWFSPSVRGTRPPPCRNFTFVCINKRQALLYGGYLPEGKIRVSDLYLFDFSDSETMDIVKLEPKKGNKWPIGRACHAACCLGYGSDNPILFVIGGGTTDEKMLPNAWTFDVVSRVWTELILPRGSIPRTSHAATSTTLSSGYEEVTIFGGCVGPAFGVSIHDIPKLANTTVITFVPDEFSMNRRYSTMGPSKTDCVHLVIAPVI